MSKKAFFLAKLENFPNILHRIYDLFSGKCKFTTSMGTGKKFFEHFSGWKSSQLQEEFWFFNFESSYKNLEHYIYIYMNISEFSLELVPIILGDFSFTGKLALNCFGECCDILIIHEFVLHFLTLRRQLSLTK